MEYYKNLYKDVQIKTLKFNLKYPINLKNSISNKLNRTFKSKSLLI
jgi:hypothetical protein